MTKFRLGIISAVAVLGLAVLLVTRQELNLREQNQVLRQQMEQLSELQAENEHLSNLLTQANNAQGLSSTQISELLRLRGEVGSLRRQTNALAKLHSENQRLRDELKMTNAATQTALTHQPLPKESWAFVGYADPESAFQSIAWAMNQGDAKVFRASLTSEGEEFVKWQNTPDAEVSRNIKQETDKVTSFKILDTDIISQDTAVLTVAAEGVDGTDTGRFMLQRIGNDWKLAGSVKEAGTRETK